MCELHENIVPTNQIKWSETKVQDDQNSNKKEMFIGKKTQHGIATAIATTIAMKPTKATTCLHNNNAHFLLSCNPHAPALALSLPLSTFNLFYLEELQYIHLVGIFPVEIFRFCRRSLFHTFSHLLAPMLTISLRSGFGSPFSNAYPDSTSKTNHYSKYAHLHIFNHTFAIQRNFYFP